MSLTVLLIRNLVILQLMNLLKMTSNIEITVQNFGKVKIPQNSCVYVRSKFFFEPSVYFVYTPSLKNPNINGHESLHSLSHINNNSFIIVLKNTSNKDLNLNKNTRLGTVTNVNNGDIQNYSLDLDEQHNCNLIVPSEEVVNKRIKDLSPDDFELSHLSREQRSALISLLCRKARVFSKSLETIGHT